MKKIALLLMLFISLGINAQKFHFIPKIGLNLSNLTSTEMGTRPGANAGLSVEMMLSPVFALEAGVSYSMQGAWVKTKSDPNSTEGPSEGNRDITTRWDIDYVNVPVYAKIYVGKGLNFFAGPQIGFNVRAGMGDNSTGAMGLYNVRDAIRPIDFSLGMGMGYVFDMGLFLSANYNLGLNGIIKNNAEIFIGGTNLEFNTDDSNANNSVFQLNLGWRF